MAPNVLDTVLLPQPGQPAIVDGRPRCSQTEITLETDYLQFFSRILLPLSVVRTWSFFTNHGRVLICIANDPRLRLRDLAAALDITERSAHGIVTDLAEAGYLVKEKNGRRNRYQVQAQLPLPESISLERTIGDVLGLLVDADTRRRPKEPKELRAL